MNNKSDQSERAALAKSTGATTFHALASAQIALEQTGRFGAQALERAAKPTIAGEEPFVKYPGGASWSRDANMLEPPLGVDVNALEPTGEAHEVAASLPAIEKAGPVSSPGLALEVAPVGVDPAQPSSPSPSHAAAQDRLAQILPKMIRRLK